MNKIFHNGFIFLTLIVIIASFLRFYDLGENPPSLSWDEAAWGYNAYSLGIDGRDEFGRFLPLDYLESFGDFKPPLYAYVSIIPVKIFGMTEFGTRFASAFFGVLTVLATYFLTKRIFFGKLKNQDSKPKIIALFSALFLAISPWHVNLSRAAFEANVATFFIIAGVLLFLTAVAGKKWLLLLSVFSFVLSIYTFNTARIVSPLLFVVLALVFHRTLWKIKYPTLLAVTIGIILMFPIVRFLASPQASLRFKEVNIFTDIGMINTTNQKMQNDNNALWSRIVNNRRVIYSIEYLKHYFDHFKPGFLFIRGDGNPKFSTQDVGQLYLWELPFFIAGSLFLFRQRIGFWWILPLWMIIGIIPAATARETPHALRIETTLPTFQIITAIGITVFLSKILNFKYFKFLIVIFIFSLLFFNFSYYVHGYYTHYPREYSGEWQYGYEESIDFVKKIRNNYDEIHITTELGRPYMYYLFYLKYDPRQYRKIAVIDRDVFGFVHVNSFDKYFFFKDLVKVENKNKKILYIDVASKIRDNIKVVKEFRLLNKSKVLVAYEM